MFQLYILSSLIPALVAAHCDPGFVKERIENTADYVCKKETTTLSDQDVLDELAALEVDQPAIEEQSSDYVTEEVEFFMASPEKQVEISADGDDIDDDDMADISTESLPTTSLRTPDFTTSTSYISESDDAAVEEEDDDMTSPPLFTTSSRNIPEKFLARLSAQSLLCMKGYEAHKIKGTEDYACKPKNPSKNQSGGDAQRSPRKLKPLPPQNQSGDSESTCGPVRNNCCTIEASRENLESDYFKLTCKDGFALKSFTMVNNKPQLECCKLPDTQ